MRRREFVAALLPALTVGGVVAPRAMAAKQQAPLAVTPLADGLWLISGAGGNVTVLRSAEGVLLVDGGSAAHSRRLLAEVRRLAGTDRVHTLFNTHWHASQTGSNLVLGKAGTRIIAHENTRLWLTIDVDSKWEGKVYPPLPRAAQPTETFYTTGSLQFGSETIDYGHLPQAHTDGDLYVFFRRANVLVAGDVVARGSFPVIDHVTNGWIGGLADAAKALAELADDNTRVVPGLGPVVDRAHLQAEQAMLATMRQRLAKLIAQGLSAEEMIEARPAGEFEAEWGDPALFIRNSYPGMAHRARELGVSIV